MKKLIVAEKPSVARDIARVLGVKGKAEGFFENEELSPTEQAQADEAALKKFVKDYRAGKFNDNLLFQFEDPSQYYTLGEYKGISYPDDELLDETVTDEMVLHASAQPREILWCRCLCRPSPRASLLRIL